MLSHLNLTVALGYKYYYQALSIDEKYEAKKGYHSSSPNLYSLCVAQLGLKPRF